MNDVQRKHPNFKLGLLILLLVLLTAWGLQGCQDLPSSSTPENTHPSISLTPTTQPTGTPEGVRTTLPETTPSATPQVTFPNIWEDFPPPSIRSATEVPPPMKDLDISDEVLVWVLLGSDTEPPFIGRTVAIHLLFIHPRFSKASLVSIPGDLYVYIPGYTMQRLNIAYALGGVETLRTTLAYNFGVLPSRFVLAHPGDFQWLVDDINGIEVTVFEPIHDACGGIPVGTVPMDGALALCYASYRQGMDEIDRMGRQQQLMQIIFKQFAQNGNLAQLPVLYASYQGWVKTDISLTELLSYVPLALRLADVDRIGYYMIGWNEIRLWEIPDQSQAQVFLPEQTGVRTVIQAAIDHLMTPEPLTNQVQTLEAQLTAAYESTLSPRATATPVPVTQTPSPTPTITPEGYP